jgi:hypothetical protein
MAHIATLLFPLLDAVHRAQGGAAGGLGRTARGNLTLGARLQMEAKLLVQFPFHLRPTKNRAQPEANDVDPA